MTPLLSVAAKEPQEENKALTIDKKLMTKLGSLQGPLSRSHLEEQALQFQELSPLQEAFHQGYTCTNGPVSLPLRRPNSGDTEILDGRAQDGELSAAEELGLMERVDTHTPQLLFFQFPKTLPLPRQADADADTNMNMSAKSMGDNRKRRLGSIHGCGLKELPGGFMGKILVFKSGKVKMTLGDVLFDVSAGSNCIFPQEVVAINTREKHCCGIGDIGKRAIITPDINSLLGSVQI
ncbi:hypothetical protein PAHAL_1G245200 [Panicum hallii]|uniref:DNA-directed RNA polymerase III subunit RPC4 n=1 Tax=Panicum hallii TaxID=206008 RepID=A0A2S3GPE1_9POAL|nr:hypothetical protein PAHAL_1G245200 [Panicum hallii]